MRRFFFWFGWATVFALPMAFAFEIWWIQDLPTIAPWKWAVLVLAVLLIVFSRNRDDVLKHRVV